VNFSFSHFYVEVTRIIFLKFKRVSVYISHISFQINNHDIGIWDCISHQVPEGVDDVWYSLSLGKFTFA